MALPQVSIIVPSYNGKDKVIRLLNSLEEQTFLSFEVVVVIDGSTDGSAAAINSIEWKLFSLKIIEQKNGGRASARNAGVQNAQCDILIFVDDDMVLAPTCIEKHIEAHLTRSNSIIMGQVIEPSNENDPEIKKYKDYLNKSWVKILEPHVQKIIPKNLSILSAQNMSITRLLFNTIGGFDEKLKDIEDYDLALRAGVKGIYVFYLDTAIALHQDNFTFRKYAERSKAYLKNRMLAASLKPDLYSKDPILKHKHNMVLKGLYSFMKYPFWLSLFDTNVVTFILPKSLRYKLYGIAITAYVHNQPK